MIVADAWIIYSLVAIDIIAVCCLGYFVIKLAIDYLKEGF